MHRKIDHMESGRVGVVGRVVIITVKQSVLRSGLAGQTAEIIGSLLPARLPIGMRGAGRTFHLDEVIPRARVIVPRIIGGLCPGVVERREVGMLAIEDGAIPRAHLREHIKRCTAAQVGGCFACGDESRDERFVEGQAGYMSAGIDPETVHAHVDEGGVTLDEIVIDGRVLRVEVHAVTGYLGEPAVGFIPVEVTVVVPVVMRVVVDAGGVLHLR